MDTQGGGGGRGHIGLGVQDNGLAAFDAETQYIAQLNIIPLFRIRIYAHTSIVRTHSHMLSCTHARTHTSTQRAHPQMHPHPHTCYLFVCSYLLVVSILLLFTLSRSPFSSRPLCALFLQKYKERMKESNRKATANTTSKATTKQKQKQKQLKVQQLI